MRVRDAPNDRPGGVRLCVRDVLSQPSLERRRAPLPTADDEFPLSRWHARQAGPTLGRYSYVNYYMFLRGNTTQTPRGAPEC
jgi:hypothetical protein